MKTLNIKVLILMIFLSGILQMDILNISWETLKIISIIHIFASIFFCIRIFSLTFFFYNNDYISSFYDLLFQ